MHRRRRHAAIANTACIMFNSRGVPIDSTFAPTGDDALYVTDGMAVYGVTVAADRHAAAVAHTARRDPELGAQLIALKSERGTTLIETVDCDRRCSSSSWSGCWRWRPSRRSTRRTTDTSRRAPPSTRRTRWSSCWRSSTPTPCRTPSYFRLLRPAGRAGRRRQRRTRLRRSTATSTGSATTADLLGGGDDAARDLVLSARLAECSA